MNDDPDTGSSASRPPRRDDGDIVEGRPDESRDGDTATASQSASDRTLKRKASLAKKLQFMTHLMRSLDLLVFAEICTLYYMECSFPRLLLRIIPHYFFLTPKSEDFLLLLPAHRPHVFAIVVPNIVCMLLHIVWSLPSAGEASRGYLHGGVIVDFIGQKAPTSKLGLLLLDAMIMIIQCIMLAVHQEREGLRKLVIPIRRNTTSSDSSTAAPTTPAQDLDAEERGILRGDTNAVDETNDVELRTLNRPTPQEADGDQENTGLLQRSSERATEPPDLMGVLRSGNATLAELHVIHAVRSAGNDYQSAAAYSLQTIGYTTTLARVAAARRARQLEGRR